MGAWRTAARVCRSVLGYVFLACAVTWPLPLRLQTHLLGSPEGDTGVYVWNLWIFRHELLRHEHLPVSTDHVFAYTGGADFSLHNYTPIAGLFALPLIGPFGPVAAYNVVLILFVALSGAAMYLLARRLGLAPPWAWLAGALFAASPVLISRTTAHLSLVTAAPLPLFLWALLRTLDSRRVWDAVLVGVFVAVASYADAYYGIYCVLMGAFLVAGRFLAWSRGSVTPARAARFVDLLIALLAAIVAWRLVNGGTDVVIGTLRIHLQTLYNPVLALVCLAAVRAWLTLRPSARVHDPDRVLARLRYLGGVAVATCLVLMLPVIIGLALRFAEGRLPGTETFWRSSPRGVDALAYVVPNPNHPWFGDITRRWFLPPRLDSFPELIASFSLVALLTIAFAAWRRLLPPFWIAFTVFFAVLSLGPFVHVAGVNTYVIGPWALLRYVPVIGMARSPSRFAVVATLGLSLLLAMALQELWRRRIVPGRPWMLAVVLVLAIELLPAPRPLHSAAVPPVYDKVAASASNPDDSAHLLELPTGVRDGTSSLGNFSPAAPFFQTRHRRPMIGGYLSRVSNARKQTHDTLPMLRALFTLSEGRPLTEDLAREAYAFRDTFLRRSCVRFVVLDKRRASPELHAFAVEALDLAVVHEDATHVLFTPIDPPSCEAAPRVHRGSVR
jgi:hypothetical protein